MDLPVHVNLRIEESKYNGKQKMLRRRIRRHLYVILVLVSAVSGFSLGQVLRPYDLSYGVHRLLALPGNLVVQGFTMLLIPLIVCGIILGFSSIRLSGSGRIVFITIAFFFTLMLLGSGIACILALSLRLGHHATAPVAIFSSNDDENKSQNLNAIFDLLQNTVPENLVLATILQKYSSYDGTVDQSNHVVNDTMAHALRTETFNKYKFGTNYIGLVIVCVIVGCAMSSLGPKVSTFYMILEETNLIVVKLMGYFTKVLPVGLFSWMCCQGLATDSLANTFSTIGVFLSTYVALQLSFQFIVLPLLYLIIVRKNPLTFHLNLLPTLLTAVGSASSSAAMPISLQCMEEKNNCHTNITRFVLPLGSVVNMLGGALGTPLCVIFVCGVLDRNLSVLDTTLVCVLTVVMQSAMPGIPSNGVMVGTLTILQLLNIMKLDAIGVFLTVDWFLDRLNTMNNVIGDCYVAAFVEKLCRKSLLRREDDMQARFVDGASLSSTGSDKICTFRRNSAETASIF